jgi:hypothetical protein
MDPKDCGTGIGRPIEGRECVARKRIHLLSGGSGYILKVYYGGAYMGANERQVGGTHYKKPEGTVEHWDLVAQWDLDYFQGQITKYVMRWRDKGGVTDLEKARHFLDKYIELMRAKAVGSSAGKGRKKTKS